MGKNEKRAFSRHSLKEAILCKLSAYSEGSQTLIQDKGKILDVSEGGICIRTKKSMDDNIEENKIVKLRISFPGLNFSFPTLAEVKWSILMGSGYRAGLRFVA